MLWFAVAPTQVAFLWFTALRATFSFILLWRLATLGFRDWTIWICLVVGWTIVDIVFEPAAVK